MKHIAWLWLFTVAACTDFEALDRGVCGNGLLEPGEDCDSSDASCVSCSVTCTLDSQCPTTAYHCGTDGLCHAPGGALADPEVVGAFEANDFRVADVDHDGTGDILGTSRSSIVVRFGDAVAPLSRIESIVTPPQTGPAAFGDIDGDLVDDISITTLDGLVSYTSEYGRMSGVPVQTKIADAGDAEVRMLFGIGPITLGAFAEVNGRLIVFIVDLANPLAALTSPAPCGNVIPIADFSPDNIDVYQVHGPSDVSTDAVISIVTGTGANQRLCVLSVHKNSAIDLASVKDITPSGPGLGRKAVLADLTNDADPCPSLVNADGGLTNLHKWDGARQTTGPYAGHCELEALSNPLPALNTALPNTPVIGRIPIRIPLIAPDALVIASGVYAYGGVWGELYHSTRPIRQAAHGDIDGDGDIDAVLRGPGDDLDVLISTGFLFQQLLIDTASEPQMLVIDDFDGNGRMDMAFTEPVGAAVRLMVAYGTADQPLPPIEVGRFDEVLTLAPLRLASATDWLATIADLVVLLPNQRSTLLSGSTNRTMLSFFDPRKDADVRNTTLFRATVIGEFVAPSTYADVVGLAALRGGVEASPVSGDAPARVGMRAWSISGTASGLDATESNGVQVENADDCSVTSGSGLCVDEAVYTAWPVAEDRDVVIAVDRRGQAYVFDPSTTSANKFAGAAFTLPQPAGSVIRSLRSADLDGDGSKELVVTFAPGAMPASAILVCDVGPTGIPSNCHDLVEHIKVAEPATIACFDAAPGVFSYSSATSEPTNRDDLLVLCRDQGTTLHRVHRTGDTYTAVPLKRLRHELTSLQIGDVTGDLVDDVIGIEGEAGARSVVVFKQCTNRDKACVAQAVGQ